MTKKVNQINVKGEIVDDATADFYNFFNMQNYTSPATIFNALKEANGNDVVVNINSGGGDVFSGSEIYSMLKSYQGNVEVNITGLAASIASVIAMAGDTVKISPTAQIMLHQASSLLNGNAVDMEHESQVLNQVDQSIINAYVGKTHLDRNQLLQMMSNETWLTAQDAVNKGFVDEVMFDEHKVPQFSNSLNVHITNETLNRFKNLKVKLQSQSVKKDEEKPKPSLRSQKLAILKGEN